MIEEASKIKRLCNKKAVFLINDSIDVALAVDADGVHLGQGDMQCKIARKLLGKQKIIGLTAHNAEEAVEAERIGADYIGLSPIFATQTKKDAGKACGTGMIKKIRKKIKIPIVAIGGINKQNVAEVIKSGADSAAAISAVLNSENVYEEVKDFIETIKKSKK